MTRLYIQSLLLCFITCIQMQAQPRDKIYPSGFYKVMRTADAGKGFYLQRDRAYFTLSEQDFLPLIAVDRVYDTLTHASLQVNIVFHSSEKKALYDYTLALANAEVGLLVNGELLLVAHITEPISGGSITYTGAFDKAHTKHIKSAMMYELMRLGKAVIQNERK